jgi:hypothetical protein
LECTRVFTASSPETPGIPARNGFTAYTALSPVTGFVATVAGGSLRRLDTSIGVSGPHGFAVRKQALSSLAPPASTASRSNVRDDGQRPSSEQDEGVMELIWGKREAEYFCKRDWTTQITLIRFNKLACARTRRPGG